MDGWEGCPLVVRPGELKLVIVGLAGTMQPEKRIWARWFVTVVF
jgi:hypothetical protein